jgi:hypothetical protein
MKTLNEMKKITLYFLLFLAVQTGLMAQISTVGTTGGNFATLKAAFDAINAGTLSGNITLNIIDNTSETETAILYESGHGPSTYTAVNIYPTVTGLTISGNIDGPLIDLNGADNITFDGRVNHIGAENLTITNASAGSSASTFRFFGSAKNNTIKYCKILGSEGSPSCGIIFFSTDGASGGGNSSNTISNNDITSYVASGRPVNAIYSNGSVSPDANQGNIISNNNIFDFLNTGANSTGVYLSSNSTGWTISGNSFYETSTFSPTADALYYAVEIDNTSGTGFIVLGNFIGGQAALCGGSNWIKTGEFNNAFTGINLNVGTGAASSVQNNTIKNFSWTNSGAASWTGIDVVGGDVNIGTTTGNIIGASGGSIIVSGGSTNTNVYGINISGTGVINCQYNNLSYFNVANNGGANATNFYGINTAASGTTTISNNTISQIVATAASVGPNSQYVYGINNSGSGNVTITSNTINNMINYTSNSDVSQTGLINGIASSAGINTISNNIINNLTIGNANTASSENASVCGIALTGSSDPKTVTGNTIYALNNYFNSFSGSIIGLYFSGSTGGNAVSGNFIYSLLPTGASFADASVYGIKIAGGASTYSNNIINLGGTTSTTIYGIYESGSATTNLYFNTVYIGGSLGSGDTNLSYALYNGSGSAQRDFRNNIFVNVRSSGSALHYAAYISTGGSITCDYNDYFVSGTGGMLGFYGGNISILPIVTGQDVNSLSNDPTFTSAGSTSAPDYKISASLPGVNSTGITVDYGLNPRGTSVTMGAWENANNLNKWTGSFSTDWNNASNWSGNILPAADASIIFSPSPANDCYLEADHSVTDITNGSTKKLVTNTHKLTIKGVFNLATSSQIDASGASSAIEFAGSGTSAQTILSGVFFNNQVYNLVVNNAQTVQLQGTLSLLNSLTVNLGQLDASTVPYYQPTMIYSGSAAQSLEANQYKNDDIYNLTIDNGTGVSINTNFNVDNILTINSAKLLNINPGKLLTVPVSIVNNAGIPGLVIKSDPTGDGKLINNTSSVDATVELYLPGGKTSAGSARFHYFVPPVQTMSFNNATPATVATDLGLTYFGGDLALYSEAAAGSNKDAGWQYFDSYNYGYGATTPFSSLVSTTGYNIYLTSNDKVTFKGTLNSAGLSFSNLSYTNIGWNLVGNPYPCNYDLNGIPELTNTGDNVDNTIYFNHDGGFAYWNVLIGGSSGYSDIIPPMQGFFVHVTASGQSLTLPASSKTAATAAPLRSKGTSSVKKLKLVLNNGLVPDETIVCLIDKATTGFDGDYDGYKLFGKSSTGEPYIYTELNGIKYAINSVPEPDTASMVIPLSVILKTDGTYKIDITEFENLDGFNVVLKHGAVETTLSKDASYSFTLAAGTYTDFQLIISKITTGIEKNTTEKLKTWYSNNFLYINCPVDISADKANLVIYDIQGKLVYNNNMISIVPGQTIQLSLGLQKGMYITRITTNIQTLVSKFVVF